MPNEILRSLRSADHTSSKSIPINDKKKWVCLLKRSAISVEPQKNKSRPRNKIWLDFYVLVFINIQNISNKFSYILFLSDKIKVLLCYIWYICISIDVVFALLKRWIQHPDTCGTQSTSYTQFRLPKFLYAYDNSMSCGCSGGSSN